MGIPMPVESVVHEVDLSDEWAALSQQLETAMQEDCQLPSRRPRHRQQDAQDACAGLDSGRIGANAGRSSR